MPFPDAIAAAQLAGLHTRLAYAVTILEGIENELSEYYPHTLGPMSPTDFGRLERMIRRASGEAKRAYEFTTRD